MCQKNISYIFNPFQLTLFPRICPNNISWSVIPRRLLEQKCVPDSLSWHVRTLMKSQIQWPGTTRKGSLLVWMIQHEHANMILFLCTCFEMSRAVGLCIFFKYSANSPPTCWLSKLLVRDSRLEGVVLWVLECDSGLSEVQKNTMLNSLKEPLNTNP